MVKLIDSVITDEDFRPVVRSDSQRSMSSSDTYASLNINNNNDKIQTEKKAKLEKKNSSFKDLMKMGEYQTLDEKEEVNGFDQQQQQKQHHQMPLVSRLPILNKIAVMITKKITDRLITSDNKGMIYISIYVVFISVIIALFFWLNNFAATGAITAKTSLEQPFYLDCGDEVWFTKPTLVRCQPICGLFSNTSKPVFVDNQSTLLANGETVYTFGSSVCGASYVEGVTGYWSTLAIYTPTNYNNSRGFTLKKPAVSKLDITIGYFFNLIVLILILPLLMLSSGSKLISKSMSLTHGFWFFFLVVYLYWYVALFQYTEGQWQDGFIFKGSFQDKMNNFVPFMFLMCVVYYVNIKHTFVGIPMKKKTTITRKAGLGGRNNRKTQRPSVVELEELAGEFRTAYEFDYNPKHRNSLRSEDSGVDETLIAHSCEDTDEEAFQICFDGSNKYNMHMTNEIENSNLIDRYEREAHEQQFTTKPKNHNHVFDYLFCYIIPALFCVHFNVLEYMGVVLHKKNRTAENQINAGGITLLVLFGLTVGILCLCNCYKFF
eukprot:Pgem_evm2s19477